MLLDEIKNIKSTKKDLRSFGLLVGAVLALIGGALLWRDRAYYEWFLAVGAALIAGGLVLPIILKPLYKPWIALSLVMGWVMTRVILSILFFLIITPIGLTARAMGKRPLQLGWKEYSKKSYWLRHQENKDGARHYERQF